MGPEEYDNNKLQIFIGKTEITGFNEKIIYKEKWYAKFIRFYLKIKYFFECGRWFS